MGMKQTIPGDFNQVSVSEVVRLVVGDASRWSVWGRLGGQEECLS
jgi:hypothetical protein